MAETPLTPDKDNPAEAGPRIDKWLWFARFFKTRNLASKICNGGKLRVNSEPIAKAHYRVRRGDVLTFPQGGRIRVIEICDFGNRRDTAAEAQTLYNDLAPPQPKPQKDETERSAAASIPERETGTGTSRWTSRPCISSPAVRGRRRRAPERSSPFGKSR